MSWSPTGNPTIIDLGLNSIDAINQIKVAIENAILEYRYLPSNQWQGRLCAMLISDCLLLWMGRSASQLSWTLMITILCIIISDFFEIYYGMVTLRHEAIKRLYSLLSMMKGELFDYQEPMEPLSPAIALVRVLRDGRWTLVPVNLLACGDIIQLSPQYTKFPIFREELSGYPSFLSRVCKPIPISGQLRLIRKRFTLHDYSCPTRAFSVFGLVLLLIIVRTIKGAWDGSSLYTILTVAYFLAGISYSSVLKIYANARIYSLISILKRSRTAFVEMGADEFDDEAPPPSQDIRFSMGAILKAMLSLTYSTDIQDSKLWSIDASVAISSSSVVSFLDREGPIFRSFPVPLETIVPNPEKEDSLLQEEVNFLNPKVFSHDLGANDSRKAFGFGNLLCSHFEHLKGPTEEGHGRYPLNSFVSQFLDPTTWICTCRISRDLGFHVSSTKHIRALRDLVVVSSPTGHKGAFTGGANASIRGNIKEGVSAAVCKLARDYNLNRHQFLAFGDLKALLPLIEYKWDSRDILPVKNEFRKKLLDLYTISLTNDRHCLAFTYRPVLHSESVEGLLNASDSMVIVPSSKESDEGVNHPFHGLIQNQIFVGALLVGYEPKEDMQDLINDLENCGVRWVYFSPNTVAVTEAIGKRLGLETDWNSCIILSEYSGGETSLFPQQYTHPKSKLPRGVKNIRPHLKSVDDVPLHISLFAESDEETAKEMIKIYRENNEPVIVIGSGLNPRNSGPFAVGDIGIIMEPSHTRNNSKKATQSSLFISSAITGLICFFGLPFDCSPYVLTEVIRESRSLVKARHSLRDFILCTISWLLMNGLNIDIEFSERNWLLLFLLLIVCIACYLDAPHEADVLKKMPNLSGKVPKGWIYFSVRYVLSGLISSITIRYVRWQLQEALTLLHLITISVSFYHEYLPITQFAPQDRVIWLIFTGLLLSISFSLGVLPRASEIILAAGSISLVFFLNELVKGMYRRKHQDANKRAKLEFSTKLGMHSPI